MPTTLIGNLLSRNNNWYSSARINILTSKIRRKFDFPKNTSWIFLFSRPNQVYHPFVPMNTQKFIPSAGRKLTALPKNAAAINKKVFKNHFSTETNPYKNQSTLQMINSLVVFQACMFPWLVKASPKIISTATRMGLSAPMNFVVKHTFFRHFCGGESLSEVVPTLSRFSSSKIGSILDLAMEADVDSGELTADQAVEATKNVVRLMKMTIDIAAHEPHSFIAAKVTALVPPQILINWTNTLTDLGEGFQSVSNSQPEIGIDQFNNIPALCHISNEVRDKLFKCCDTDLDGKVSKQDLFATFSLHSIPTCRHLITPSTSNRIKSSDLDTAALLMSPINEMCEYAKTKRVKIMMDAEQTYFQAAIDDVSLGLCRIHNPRTDKPPTTGDGPVIFNTYQMYLVSAESRLYADVSYAQKQKYSIGLKIVRGAYATSERALADSLNKPSPINPTITSTHQSYNSALEFLLKRIKTHLEKPNEQSPRVRPVEFVVASHNPESIRLASTRMQEYNIKSNEGYVGFAQLMGMQDQTTYSLAESMHQVYKV